MYRRRSHCVLSVIHLFLFFFRLNDELFFVKHVLTSPRKRNQLAHVNFQIVTALRVASSATIIYYVTQLQSDYFASSEQDRIHALHTSYTNYTCLYKRGWILGYTSLYSIQYAIGLGLAYVLSGVYIWRRRELIYSPVYTGRPLIKRRFSTAVVARHCNNIQ